MIVIGDELGHIFVNCGQMRLVSVLEALGLSPVGARTQLLMRDFVRKFMLGLFMRGSVQSMDFQMFS